MLDAVVKALCGLGHWEIESEVIATTVLHSTVPGTSARVCLQSSIDPRTLVLFPDVGGSIHMHAPGESWIVYSPEEAVAVLRPSPVE